MLDTCPRSTATRVWATVILFILSSLTPWSVAGAEEPLSERTDPSRGAVQLIEQPRTSESPSPSESGSKKRKESKKPPSVGKSTPTTEANGAPTASLSEPVKADDMTTEPSVAVTNPAETVTSTASGAENVDAAILDAPWTAERTIELLIERAMAHGSSAYEVLAVARCETGYTFMPWRANGNLLRGSQGEVGVGQWLPPVERNHWGRTPHWREHGYHVEIGYLSGDPSAIWWDADALAWSMGPMAPAGFRSGWSCWRIRGPWWFV
ncbi:MAG: hypothetical protein ACKVVP_18880 [Chloroflexota bacterium]